MSEQACPVRSAFAHTLLLEEQDAERLASKFLVALGSSEHPERELVGYVRRAEDERFHIVRRADGSQARVHDQAFTPEDLAYLAVHPYPNGRLVQ